LAGVIKPRDQKFFVKGEVMLRDLVSGLKRGVCLLAVSALLAPGQLFAQEAGGAAAKRGFFEVFMQFLPMFLMVWLVFYFLVIRPQDRKLKSHRQLIDNLKKGDRVVTSSGIISRVAGIEKGYILLEIAQGVKVKFDVAHIEQLYKPADQKDSGKVN